VIGRFDTTKTVFHHLSFLKKRQEARYARFLERAYNSRNSMNAIRDIIKKDPHGLIARAYAFGEKAHRGQKRKSGEPYFSHPVAVADILKLWNLDETTIAAGLLHDTAEDTSVTIADITKEFGENVAFIVDGVTKLGRVKYRGAERKAENMRKMILATSRDLRVVFVKLADRLHNMRTLSALPPAKQKRIALETDEIYAPLAYRLGMQNISGEMQDLAFPYLHPKEHEWLKKTAQAQYEKRLHYLEKIKPEVEALLKRHDVPFLAIDFRAKRYSSLYKKLLRHDMDLAKIYDLVAMRIIVSSIPECYAVLGVIHEKWRPLPGRIKDYIALPKPNSYRSLHTTIIGPDDMIIEFQIRTKEMHEESENGITAHWLYKQKHAIRQKINTENEITWVQKLRSWQEHADGQNADPNALLEAMKVDFFSDRIFVITPKGEALDLPAGATPIDFAYHIHSDIGDSCTGARVNGMLVPLDHILNSGDMVEIFTQKGKRPSEDWLTFVRTSIARDRIRAAIKEKRKIPSLAIRTGNRAELKIAAEDRTGLIKDISTTIARNHANILAFHSENSKGSHYPFDRVEIQTTDKAKIEKLIMKLKAIPGVKEVSYKII
jgi:GTP pyrophosphokinase